MAVDMKIDRTAGKAFQDLIPYNHCWGCGPLNRHGLQIKSYWQVNDAICSWQPQPEHAAGPEHILNGGIIATLFDCHGICTAIAAAYRRENRPMDSAPALWYATGSLQVTYLQPTPIGSPVLLRAHIVEVKGKKTIVTCSLASGGEECGRAEVVAIQVPPEWRQA